MSNFELTYEKAFSYLVYNQEIYRRNVKEVVGIDISDPKEIRRHWLCYGIEKGISGSDIFDINWFVQNNKIDLDISDRAKIIEYWIDSGIDQGLSGSGTFSAKDYGKLHSDLKTAFGNNYRELAKHWNNHGRREKRQCIQEKPLNEQDRLIQENGIDVGSTFVFDIAFYKEQLKDLGLNDLDTVQDYLKHWRTVGVNEGLRSSLIFDVKYYINKNKKVIDDGIKNNYSLAIEHWLNVGIKKGCQGSKEFNISSYLKAHKDLQEAFGEDYEKALNHWIQHGYREGRETSLPEEVKESIFLSNVRKIWPKFLQKSTHEKNVKAYLSRYNQLSQTPQSVWKRAENDCKRLASIYKSHGPLVSIIVPYHNREITIELAIDSVLSQTYGNYEIILIDNKSKRPIKKFLDKKYAKDICSGKLKIIDTNVGGVCPARNLGLSIANGKYIAYLDSDNFWNKDFLRIMVGILESERSDCAYSSVILANLDTRKIKLHGQQFNLDKLKSLNYIDMNCFVHTRELYNNKGGFDISLKRLVDWDLILKYCNGSKVSFCHAPLVHYISASYIDSITSSEKLFPPYELISRRSYSDHNFIFSDDLKREGGKKIAYILWDQPSNSEKFINYELEWLVQSGFTVNVFYKRNASNSFINGVEYLKIDSSDELADELTNRKVDFAFTHFIYPTTTLLTMPACEKAKVPAIPDEFRSLTTTQHAEEAIKTHPHNLSTKIDLY